MFPKGFNENISQEGRLNPTTLIIFSSTNLVSFSTNGGLNLEEFCVFVTKLEPIYLSFLGIEHFLFLKEGLEIGVELFILVDKEG